jgi:hypothetical protein
MVSSGLLRSVALVRTDVSEEPSASFIKVTKISELGTTQAATSNRRTLRRSSYPCHSSRTLHVLLYLPICLIIHVVAQEVRRGLPNAAARICARVKSCGICGGQRGTGTSFLEVFRFPLPFILSTNCSTHMVGTIGAMRFSSPVAANVVPSSLILSKLKMKAPHSTEMSALTESTPRNIPECRILRGHRGEDFKSYNLK